MGTYGAAKFLFSDLLARYFDPQLGSDRFIESYMFSHTSLRHQIDSFVSCKLGRASYV